MPGSPGRRGDRQGIVDSADRNHAILALPSTLLAAPTAANVNEVELEPGQRQSVCTVSPTRVGLMARR